MSIEFSNKNRKTANRSFLTSNRWLYRLLSLCRDSDLFQRNRSAHPTHQSTTTTSTPHPTNRRSTQRIRSVQERKKRKEQWETNRYSHWHRMNKLILMFVLFGYITNNSNQKNVHQSKRMMMHCRSTLQCHHVQWWIYLFVLVLAHTHIQTTTQHTQTKAAV